MATPLTLLTQNTKNPKSETMEDYHGAAKPGAAAMEFVKNNNNKGRKPNGKGPNPKTRKPQRGMGVEKLERLRKESESKNTMNQFPCHEQLATNVVPVLHGLAANYGVPVPPTVINGWGTCGVGFGGFNGQVLLGKNNHGGNVLQAGSGFVEASSKELSSIPKFHQYCQPDPCDLCFKKRYDGENGKFNGGLLNQFGQIFPNKGAEFHGYWNQENNQKRVEAMNGFTARAAKSAYAYTAGQMNTNETVDVVAVHRKGNSFGSGGYVMEYEFFPGKKGRNTASKEWEFLPNQEPSTSSPSTGFAVMNGEPSSSSSKCVDLSLKLSY